MLSRERNHRMRKCERFWWTVGFSVALSTAAFAQGVVGVDPTGRSGDAPSLLKDARPEPSQPPTFSLPPLSSTHTVGSPFVRVRVREIRLTGNTAFSTEELASVTAAYVNREVSSEDLEDLRLALTRYYVDRGYVNSGAYLPDQTVADGSMTLQIIEGTLTGVEIEGNRWTRARYLQDRLALPSGTPLNVHVLSRQLQLLQQDDRINHLNAELRPGLKPGEGILRVRVHEEQPYSLVAGFNNYQSPTVGEERGILSLVHRSLTGNGDTFSLTYGQSDGVIPQIDVSYAVPVTAQETSIMFHYRRNDFTVVEVPFTPLDITSDSSIFGVTLRHPLYRTPHHELAISLSGEHLRNKTFLDNVPFSFSPGARNGRSQVSALRITGEWIARTSEQVIALRSRFSLGVDVLGATNNRSGRADGQFFAWLGQLQWARRWVGDVQTITRLDLQLTPNPLLSLEQLAVGGRYSVRGYRENQLVRDNGLLSSLEVRVPVLRNALWAEWIELAPFVDVGHAWNRKGQTSSPSTLIGVGMGLRWTFPLLRPLRGHLELEVYWGYALRDIRTTGGTLQDEGVHLQLLVPVL